MAHKILIAALPLPGTFSSVEATSIVTREIRSFDRTLPTHDVLQLPILTGCDGAIDFLVTHTLGSFLEVEATGAMGEQLVVPIGFAGEDGRMAVIEAPRVAGVPSAGMNGTTYGIGELIQDSLDEGAFSIVIANDDNVAADGGLGAVAALGVTFFDKNGAELPMRQPVDLSKIYRVDASGRSFQALSARFFLASAQNGAGPSAELRSQLERIAGLIERDCGVTVSMEDLSTSALEFGFRAFLSTEVRPAEVLFLDAAGIDPEILAKEIGVALLVAPDAAALSFATPLLERCVKTGIPVHVVTRSEETALGDTEHGDVTLHSLADVPLFQAPLSSNAGPAEIRRDFIMRLQKLLPMIYESELRPAPKSKSKKQVS